ncbi:MAG TPA: serine hydrolase [Gaiellaceae bacterium]|nr:serine hydrolase [Gaiellaceae bacterium]
MVVATPASLPPLPPPAITQPAPRQVSYGLVTGRAPSGTRWVVVSVNGRALASRPVREGRRIWLRVPLPTGAVRVRVTTATADGRASSTVVRDVFGLPRASAPRIVRDRRDALLMRKVRRLARRFAGTAGVYAQSLTGGHGGAWNAKARFPAASTLKLAIAAAVLERHRGLPEPGSYIDDLLVSMLTRSDNAAANALEVWLAGSTSAGSHRVNSLMRSIGMTDSEMYGGYEIGTHARRIPVEVDEQPSRGYGKQTTARDMATLFRAIWLASGGRGPFPRKQPGLTTVDARYLLWILAHVRDLPKLDRVESTHGGVAVMHKAGWVTTSRHDAGLVFWRGGVFVAGVMTHNRFGVGVAADVLAGRVASTVLARLQRIEG